MLYSLTKSESPPLYMINGKEYTVGRKGADLIIEKDQSISRKHATIKVGPAGPVLIDNGSKYHTVHQGKIIKSHVEVPLHHNDLIKFGVYESLYQFQHVELIITGSGLETNVKQKLKQDLNFLNGRYEDQWIDQCTHLTVQEIMLTAKVLHALIDNKPIVTPQFWSEVAECVKKKKSSPHIKQYKPPIGEQLLNNEVDLCFNEKRPSLFRGKVFVFPNNKIMDKMSGIIIKTSGSCISWEKNPLTLPEILKGSDKYIFTRNEDLSESKSFKDMIKHLSRLNQRAIPLQEIAMAILLGCCTTNCNPNFDRTKQVFVQSKPSVPPYTQVIELAPKSQSLVYEIDIVKPETVIPATYENDIDDVETPKPSTSCGLKRSQNQDLNEEAMKKSKIEESPIKKRKPEEDVEFVDTQPAKRAKNPFFSTKRDKVPVKKLAHNPFPLMRIEQQPLTGDGNPFKQFLSKNLKKSPSPSGLFKPNAIKVPEKRLNDSSLRSNISVVTVKCPGKWLSKANYHEAEVFESPEEFKAICEKFRNVIRIQRRPLADLTHKNISMITTCHSSSSSLSDIKNFKKFRKVLPLRAQSTIITSSKSYTCGLSDKTMIDATRNDEDNSDEEDRPRQMKPPPPVVRSKATKKRFNF